MSKPTEASESRPPTTQQWDVLNLAKGWAREVEAYFRAQGWDVDDKDRWEEFTSGERRLYLAVVRLRKSEARQS
jgi:hypothetical protein